MWDGSNGAPDGCRFTYPGPHTCRRSPWTHRPASSWNGPPPPPAGAAPPPSTEAEATLLVLRGRVRLTSGETTWEGRNGDLIVIPGPPRPPGDRRRSGAPHRRPTRLTCAPHRPETRTAAHVRAQHRHPGTGGRPPRRRRGAGRGRRPLRAGKPPQPGHEPRRAGAADDAWGGRLPGGTP